MNIRQLAQSVPSIEGQIFAFCNNNNWIEVRVNGAAITQMNISLFAEETLRELSNNKELNNELDSDLGKINRLAHDIFKLEGNKDIQEKMKAVAEKIEGMCKERDAARINEMEIVSESGLIDMLPNEVVRMLFEHMSLEQRTSIARVCKLWAFLIKSFPLNIPERVVYYGPEKLERLMGKSVGVVASPSEALVWIEKHPAPLGMQRILGLIPEISFNAFEENAKGIIKDERWKGYDCVCPLIKETWGKEIQKAHWAVMTVGVLPGTEGKSSDEQVKIIEKRAPGCELPGLIDATVLSILHYTATGESIFPHGNTWDESRYTRCKEQVNFCKVVVGLGALGLVVDFIKYDNYPIGAAALKKFSVIVPKDSVNDVIDF